MAGQMVFVTPSKQIDLEGDLSDLSIDDVAWCLAHQVRFNGALGSHLTVAIHSLEVSNYVEALGGTQEEQLAGLLHDAHEALLGDWTRPVVSVLGEMVAQRLREVKDAMDRRIERRLGLPPNILAEPIVRRADEMVLRQEIKAARGATIPVGPSSAVHDSWTQRQQFLGRFFSLS